MPLELPQGALSLFSLISDSRPAFPAEQEQCASDRQHSQDAGPSACPIAARPAPVINISEVRRGPTAMSDEMNPRYVGTEKNVAQPMEGHSKAALGTMERGCMDFDGEPPSV